MNLMNNYDFYQYFKQIFCAYMLEKGFQENYKIHHVDLCYHHMLWKNLAILMWKLSESMKMSLTFGPNVAIKFEFFPLLWN